MGCAEHVGGGVWRRTISSAKCSTMSKWGIGGGPMKVAFLSDIHFNDTDIAAWNLTLRILKNVDPDAVFWGGDIIDEVAASEYAKDPKLITSFQDELDAQFLGMSRARELLPKAKMWFRDGNHEERVIRLLHSKAQSLSSLRNLSLPSLLRLNELDVEHMNSATKFRIGELFFLHGHEQACGYVYPARNLYLKLGVNIIAGHFHRFNSYTDTRYDGATHGVWVNGTLQQLSPDFLKGSNQWTQGISIIDFTRSGRFNVHQMSYFHEADCVRYVLGGELFEEKIVGSERTPGKSEIVSYHPQEIEGNDEQEKTPRAPGAPQPGGASGRLLDRRGTRVARTLWASRGGSAKGAIHRKAGRSQRDSR